MQTAADPGLKTPQHAHGRARGGRRADGEQTWPSRYTHVRLGFCRQLHQKISFFPTPVPHLPSPASIAAGTPWRPSRTPSSWFGVDQVTRLHALRCAGVACMCSRRPWPSRASRVATGCFTPICSTFAKRLAMAGHGAPFQVCSNWFGVHHEGPRVVGQPRHTGSVAHDQRGYQLAFTGFSRAGDGGWVTCSFSAAAARLPPEGDFAGRCVPVRCP